MSSGTCAPNLNLALTLSIVVDILAVDDYEYPREKRSAGYPS